MSAALSTLQFGFFTLLRANLEALPRTCSAATKRCIAVAGSRLTYDGTLPMFGSVQHWSPIQTHEQRQAVVEDHIMRRLI